MYSTYKHGQTEAKQNTRKQVQHKKRTEAPDWSLRLEQNSLRFIRPSSRSSEVQIWWKTHNDFTHNLDRPNNDTHRNS